MRDRHTQIPGYGHFLDLDRVLGELPVASEPIDVAFVDVAGFGAWNTAHGQVAGDEVLTLLAATLDEIPAARVIRDGGDEFLVIGAPRRDAMDSHLQSLLDAWPTRWAAAFGSLPIVSPRMVVMAARAGDLRSARERLGRSIGDLKVLAPDPGPHGILVKDDG
jgi:GGDEF domain-containing protein